VVLTDPTRSVDFAVCHARFISKTLADVLPAKLVALQAQLQAAAPKPMA
jgi:hypothetical protein